MHPSIFREYDIRGIVGQDLSEADAVLIGRGLGTYLQRRKRRRLTLGRDCRLSSEAFARGLAEGLVGSGCEVTDIGVCPTPVLYFSIQHLGQEGGAMITASHNPPEYNGFKLCIGGDSIYGAEIQELRRLIDARDFAAGPGSLRQRPILPEYIDFLSQNLKLARPLRVGVDAGNGTAGVAALPVLQRLGCEVHPLYCTMDGTFPNHPADPTVAANLQDLIALVMKEGLDLGLAFDGDGDRLGVVDARGRIIHGDQLMIVFAREILARRPGATFIGEVKCSQTMYDDIERHGGRAIMWKTGHSLIKAKMKQEDAMLAGEMSGHLFFADRYLGYDDAVYAAGRLLEILASTGRDLAALLADIPPTVSTPEIRVDCPDDRKFDIVARVTDHFRARRRVIDIDGARILFDNGWGLVRASNTQPALVLRFEANSVEQLHGIRREVEDALAGLQGTA